jgi:hypothetical protein
MKSCLLKETDTVADGCEDVATTVVETVGGAVVEAVGAAVVVARAIVPVAGGEVVVVRGVALVCTGTIVTTVVVAYGAGPFVDAVFSPVVDVHPTKITAAITKIPKRILNVSADLLFIPSISYKLYKY